MFRKYEVITKKYLRTKDHTTNKSLDILYSSIFNFYSCNLIIIE